MRQKPGWPERDQGIRQPFIRLPPSLALAPAGQAALWLLSWPDRLASSPLHRPVAMAVNLKGPLGKASTEEKGSVLLNPSDSILVDFRVLEGDIITTAVY